MSEGDTQNQNTGLVHNAIPETDTGYIKKEKLEEKLRRLFHQEIRVRVMAVRPLNSERESFLTDPGTNPTPTVFTNNSQFEEYIVNTPQTGTQIISLCSENSVFPLQISEDAFLKLQQTYKIDSELSHLAQSFGDKPLNAEAGYGAMTVREKKNGIHDMAYLFSYPEGFRINKVSWTMRQVAVFHRYDPSGLENLWIFFHSQPKPKSLAQQRIESYISQYQQHPSVASTWEALHSAVLSPYLDNWRAYLQHLGSEVEDHMGKALTIDLAGTPNYWTKDGYENLLKLHHLGDKLLPITGRLQATISTMTKLEELSHKFCAGQSNADTATGFMRMANRAAYHKTCLEGMISGGEILGKKVKDVLDMLELALSLRINNKMLDLNNQMLDFNKQMVTVNKQMYKLTAQSFDDNATVKVVTMVTLTYLPASFIASFLGMNLFTFGNPRGHNFTVSNRIWVFFLLAVPLTLLTLGTWRFFTEKERKERGKKEQRRVDDFELRSTDGCLEKQE